MRKVNMYLSQLQNTVGKNTPPVAEKINEIRFNTVYRPVTTSVSQARSYLLGEAEKIKRLVE